MSLDVYLSCPHCGTIVHEGNVTHNLVKMAREAGIYGVCWRPQELGLTKAKDLIPHLERGLKALHEEPSRFKAYNPENGWGNYDGLLSFAQSYLNACRKHPDADVEASR